MHQTGGNLWLHSEDAFIGLHKPKIHWRSVGDQSNKFFHRVAQARRSKNAIRVFRNTDGDNIYSVEGVEKEAESWGLGFFVARASGLGWHTG